MSTLLKKLTFSFLSFLVLFYSIAPNFLIAKAQQKENQLTRDSNEGELQAPSEGSWYNQGFDQWYNKVYDENTSPGSEIFGERYTAAQVQWVIYSLFAFILNASLGNSSTSQKAVACFITNSANIETCGEALNDLFEQTTNNGTYVIPQKNDKNLFQLVFADKPFSGINYTKERFKKFDLVPEVQAQSPGFGFSALGPIQDMWRASRDVAFGLFVIVAIIFAFMIMFRVKISPQVVISIQSSIPKLILALILVTFSYAIAGFLVDLMYIVIGILSLILPRFAAGTNLTPPDAFNLLTGVGTSGNQEAVWGLMGYSFVYLAVFTLTLLVLLSQYVSVILIGLAAGGLTFLTGGLAPLLVIILIIVAVIICIWNMIKTWWMLIKAFVNILLLTIFAPLQIMVGTLIPNFGFGSWVRSFSANLATFVVTGFLMVMAMIFLLHAWNNTGFGLSMEFLASLLGGSLNPFNPDFSPYWPPLLGSRNSQAVVGFMYLGVSFVLFTLIPKSAEVIQGFITGKPFAYGTAIGEAFGPVRGAWNLGVTQAIRKEFAEESAADILSIASGVAGRLAPGKGIARKLSKYGERAEAE